MLGVANMAYSFKVYISGGKEYFEYGIGQKI